MLHPIPRPRVRTALRRHGVVHSLKCLISASDTIILWFSSPYSALLIITAKEKLKTGMQHNRVWFHCNVFFFSCSRVDTSQYCTDDCLRVTSSKWRRERCKTQLSNNQTAPTLHRWQAWQTSMTGMPNINNCHDQKQWRTWQTNCYLQRREAVKALQRYDEDNTTLDDCADQCRAESLFVWAEGRIVQAPSVTSHRGRKHHWHGQSQ